MSIKQPHKLALGFVSWLDVLGYKEVLSCNQPGKTASTKLDTWLKVLDLLDKVRHAQFEHGLTKFQTDNRGLCESMYQSKAFTDSIVTSVDLSGSNLQELDRSMLVDLFLLRNAFLTRLMFEEGLPTRGGISYGHFLHTNLGFAGEPFVEAERLSSRLELSACVLSESCMEYHRPVPSYLAFVHDCPLKSKPAAMECRLEKLPQISVCPLRQDAELHRLTILNFASRAYLKATNDASEFKVDFSATDLEELVKNSFEKHDKPIEAASVKRKIQNTVQMLEKAREKFGMQFS